jgi:hypothetical protein
VCGSAQKRSALSLTVGKKFYVAAGKRSLIVRFIYAQIKNCLMQKLLLSCTAAHGADFRLLKKNGIAITWFARAAMLICVTIAGKCSQERIFIGSTLE